MQFLSFSAWLISSNMMSSCSGTAFVSVCVGGEVIEAGALLDRCLEGSEVVMTM